MKKYKSNLYKVVNALNDYNHIDGNSIGDQLSITRSAVWKIIKKLLDLGVKIESIKGKGYRLLEMIKLLDEDLLSQTCTDLGIELIILESVDSTNDYVKQFFGLKKPYAVFSELQTKGKGRLNREWYSPFGQNIYFSLLHVVQKDVSELSGLSLVISLATLQTCKQFLSEFNVQVKWPNDITFNNQKVAGSLVEIQAEANGLTYITIGIGLNVNMIDANDNIKREWTSINNICGRYIDRNDICKLLLINVTNYLQNFEKFGFKYFFEEWQMYDCLFDKDIEITNAGNTYRGIVQGVNDSGNIIIKTCDRVVSCSSGDTSIIRY